MKQKYTVTVAGMDINIITDEAPEKVESVVGTIDRRIREINLRSPRCSRTESALLCAMDYCADKLALGERVKTLEAEIAELIKPDEGKEALEAELKVAREALEAKKAELASALERADLLESGADELAESVRVKEQRLEALSAENAELSAENNKRAAELERLNEENSALRAELEELRASRAVKAEKIAFFAETGKDEIGAGAEASAEAGNKPGSEVKVEPEEQMTIDGSDIPQASVMTPRRRERRLRAFDLLNNDDV